MKVIFSKYNNAQKGTIIFGLIITMAFFSTIGAAMLSLTGASTFSQVNQNSSANALYLAESGFRYLHSQYLDATGETARDNLLEGMHDKTYHLSGNDGQFHIDIYPFYFKITSNPVGSNELITKVPGGFSPDITLSSGKLKIGSVFFDYTSAAVTGQNVTFTMAETMPFFSIDTDVMLVAESLNGINSGELDLKSGTAQGFPALNGTVEINNKIYTYKNKKRGTDKLTGIKDPTTSEIVSFEVDAGTNVILTKFIKFHSTGIYGSGNFEAKKTIKYNLPLPYTPPGEKQEFHDTFENKDHWEESVTGSHEIIDNNKVLKVTPTELAGGTDEGSSISFKWSSTNIDLDSSHKFAGNYLSYDAQVKIGFDPLIQENYMGGLSFRLVSNTADADRYGVSFLKGGGEGDNIPDELVPKNGIPLILLWQKTDAGKKWLAYKKINSLLSEDVESDSSDDWSHLGLWHISSNQNHSPGHSWYCTGDATTEQQLISPKRDLNDSASSVTLSFWSWYKTNEEGNSTKRVEISTDSGNNWSPINQLTFPYDERNTWKQKTVNLAPYINIGETETIKIRFVFDTVTANGDNSEGWYIDDINITFDLNGSTLMVRLNEAATVPFEDGKLNGGEAAPISGDFITGSSGATGRVTGNPVLESGSWSGGDAKGIITINNIAESFADGETINVAGSSATATVSGTFSKRDNYIRVYYGDQTGSGALDDGSLLDDLRHGIPFGETHWPPDNVDEWAADNDFFTLVQWDEINIGVDLIDSIYEPDAIIRSSESGIFDHTKPELGLHTFGSGSTNIYFDDFALQAITGSDTVYFSPIQE